MSSTIAVLKQLIQLEEKRSRLAQELASLDSQVASLKRGLAGNGSAGLPSAPQSKNTPGRKPQSNSKPQAAAKPAASKPSAAPAANSNGSNGSRGGLAERIMQTLKSAGAKGIAIKDIADKTDSGYRNIAVWFATTGKKYKAIKKVAPATYRLA